MKDESVKRTDVVKSSSPRPILLEAKDLFRGAEEIRIRHQGSEYRLRITRQGKLILTK